MIAEMPHQVAGSLGQGRQACVLDSRLALSRHGLLAVARLATEFDVWIPSSVFQILRDLPTFQSNAALSAGAITAVEDATAAGGSSRLWDDFPEDDDLSALRSFYLGERAEEYLTPPTSDRVLRDRFEQLRESLPKSTEAAGDIRSAYLGACTGDALALCAALQGARGFVLTRLHAGHIGEPALCGDLRRWNIEAREVGHKGGRVTLQLRNQLARAEIGQMAWGGIDLCAVHVLLPGFTVFGGVDRRLDLQVIRRLWSRVEVFWHHI